MDKQPEQSIVREEITETDDTDEKKLGKPKPTNQRRRRNAAGNRQKKSIMLFEK